MPEITLDAALEKARRKTVQMKHVHYILPFEDSVGGEPRYEIGVEARYDALFVIEPVGQTQVRVIDRRGRPSRNAA